MQVSLYSNVEFGRTTADGAKTWLPRKLSTLGDEFRIIRRRNHAIGATSASFKFATIFNNKKYLRWKDYSDTSVGMTVALLR